VKKIVLTFDETGECTVEAVDFKGHGCRAATKPYEQALFDGPVVVTQKPEIHQAETAKTTQGAGR
jgi:hypothetical protein